MKAKTQRESRAPLGNHRHSDVDTVTGIVNPALPLSVTPNAAQSGRTDFK